MTATLTDRHDAAGLIAGANAKHGRHERTDEGWDAWQREHHGDDPDALTRGRHSAAAPVGGAA